MFRRAKFHPYYFFVALLLSIFAGIIWAKFESVPSAQFAVLGLLVMPAIYFRNFVSFMPIIFLGIALGLWRGSVVSEGLKGYQQFIDHKVVLSGTISDTPAYSDNGQLEFYAHDVEIAGVKLPGKVRVRGFGSMSRRGEWIEATGTLRSGFGPYQAAIYYAQVEVLATETSLFSEWRSRFSNAVYSMLPDSEAALGLGFLVGERTSMSEELQNSLRATGLTHIVAVSGYNLTVLIRLSRRSLQKRSKFLAMAGSCALLTSFLLVTGLSPSVARAAVVAGLALLAWYFGRPVSPVFLILFAATLTAFINPMYPWFDLGWYLSFLAFFGVMVLAPLIEQRILKKKPKLIGQLALETTSAQVLTLPLILTVFGELSLISLIANIVILPLIPLAMLLTFIGGATGMISPIIGGWVIWPAKQLLSFIIDVSSWLAAPSWALTSFQITVSSMVFIYVLICFLALIWRFKTKRLNAQTLIE